jgi:hypothetical protein
MVNRAEKRFGLANHHHLPMLGIEFGSVVMGI